MKGRGVTSLVVVLASALFEAGVSQESSPPHRKVCFRGLPTCASFPLTEASIGFRLNQDPMEVNPSGRLLSGHVGWMWNLSERAAFGATVFLGYGDKADGYGLQPRVRLRMTRTFSVDLAPGLVQHVHTGGGGSGFAGLASLNYDDWLAVTVQALRVQPTSPFSTRRVAWYGGVRLGSYPGIVISAATALVFGLAVLISPPTGT